jgi:threonine dehydrogenase-like Zn-dependent dehydrogenase
MRFTRPITAASLIGVLAACGGGEEPSVRNGPQAVHPSPSALASGVRAAPQAAQVTSVQHIVIINATIPCGENQNCRRGKSSYGPNDGSRPIID